MPSKVLDPLKPGHNEDWVEGSAAFTCQECGKVFLVTPLHVGPDGRKGCRPCPSCGKSVGRVGSGSDGSAILEW